MRVRIPLVILFVSIGASCVSARAQSYSNSDLLSEAGRAYDSDQCVRAARFAFAYLLRNPTAQSPLKGNLDTIISWCEQHTTVAGVTKGDGFQPDPQKPSVHITAPPGGGVHVETPAGPVHGTPVHVLAPPPHPKNPTEKRCTLYATLAATQSHLNEIDGCGFSGARWNSEYEFHYNWCLGAKAAEAQAESTTRLSMLNQCAP